MYPQATDAAGGYEAAVTATIYGVGEVCKPRPDNEKALLRVSAREDIHVQHARGREKDVPPSETRRGWV